MNEEIVIGMPLKNNAKTIKRAMMSVLSQKCTRRNLTLLIANDNSTDNWQEEISTFLNLRVIIVDVNFGRTYAVRNFILDYVQKNMPNTAYIGRLDADDFLADNYVISKIEQVIEKFNPDVIVAGNEQVRDGKIIGTNRADRRLLVDEYLEKRLFQMKQGIWEGELPSCNVFVKPHVKIRYKEIDSAEDHWYLVELLLNKDKYSIYFAEDIIYSMYSLDGKTTHENIKNKCYMNSRQMLYEYFIEQKVIKSEKKD